MLDKCTFEKNGDDVIIIRKDRNEIMFATYREDYWDEIRSETWRLNTLGYPECSKLGLLHRYIMGKWYGEKELRAFTDEGYVVDHLDNQHNNCRISNLEFLKKDFNTAKGQWLDKQVEELRECYALAIYKDFSTGFYQITIGMNSIVQRSKADGSKQVVDSVKFLYKEDYPTVITNAQMMLLNLESGTFNPHKYNACAIRVYDSLDVEFTEAEKEQAIVIRNGIPLLVIGNGKAIISKVAPEKGWLPSEDGKIRYEILKPQLRE